jgi:hypothetical protein
MHPARLRRYGLRVVAAASVGAVLLVGVGVANAQTTAPASGTITIVRNLPSTDATAADSKWE